MALSVTSSRQTSVVGSEDRDLTVNFNLLADAVEQLLTGDLLLSAPGLAIGTSSKAAIKYSAFQYQIDGVRATAAGAEKAFTATTHDIADPDSDPREAIYVLSIASGGTVTITKGTTAAEGAAVAPSTPAGEIKMGEVLIQHDGSAIFDATTDELDEAHLTVTYTDEDPYSLTAKKIGDINGDAITS